MRCFSHRLIFAACLLLCTIAASPRVASKELTSEWPIARYEAAPARTNRQQSVEPTTLQNIRQRGDIMVAGVPYDFAPYSYVGDDGELTGFDVELLEAIANEWGVEVEFLPALAADNLTLLAAGTVDVAPVVWPTLDIAKLARAPSQIDFSQPYLSDSWCLFNYGSINGAASGALDSAPENPYPIGYISGLADDDLLSSWALDALIPPGSRTSKLHLSESREIGSAIASLDARQNLSLLTFERHCRYLEEMGSEQGDTASTLSHTSIPETASGLEGSLPTIYTVWGLADSSSETRNLFNYTLQKLVRSGDYKRIFGKWFPEEKVPPIELFPGRWQETFQSLSNADIEEPLPDVASAALDGPTELTTIDADLAREYSLGGIIRIGVPFDYPPFGLQLAGIAPSILTDDNSADQPSPDGQDDSVNLASKADSTLAKFGLAGLDIDIALAIVEHINQQMFGQRQPSNVRSDSASSNAEQPESLAGDLPQSALLEIEFVPVAPQTSEALLSQGALDMVVAAASPNWSEPSNLGFSQPYLRDRIGLLVPSDINDPTLEGADDNRTSIDGTGADGAGADEANVGANSSNSVGAEAALSFDILAVEALAPTVPTRKTIACVVGDYGAELWFSQVSRLQDEHSFGSSCRDFLPFLELSTALRAVEAGQADGLIGSAEVLRYAASQHDSLQLIDELNAPVVYSAAVHPKHVLLRRAVDAAILEMNLDGTMALLHEKWLVEGTLGERSQLPMNFGQDALIQALPRASVLAASALDVSDVRAQPPLDKTVGRSNLRVGDIVVLSGADPLPERVDTQMAEPQTSASELVSTGALAVNNVDAVSGVAVKPTSALQALSSAISTSVTAEITNSEPSSTGESASVRIPSGQSHRVDFDIYIVRVGDTLSSIAVTIYGDQSNWLLLYEANRTLIGSDPSLLVAGTTLYIPKLSQP